MIPETIEKIGKLNKKELDCQTRIEVYGNHVFVTFWFIYLINSTILCSHTFIISFYMKYVYRLTEILEIKSFYI